MSFFFWTMVFGLIGIGVDPDIYWVVPFCFDSS
jgi:hypothetical protein